MTTMKYVQSQCHDEICLAAHGLLGWCAGASKGRRRSVDAWNYLLHLVLRGCPSKPCHKVIGVTCRTIEWRELYCGHI